MTPWLISVVAGIVLGALLALCVAFRMIVGPAAGQRFGSWARRAVWFIALLLMLLAANLMLLAVNSLFGLIANGMDLLPYEIGFALIGACFGLYAVNHWVRPVCLRREAEMALHDNHDGGSF